MNTQTTAATASMVGHTHVRKWGRAERLCLVWAGLALLALVPVCILLQGALPIFTVLWLIVPLVTVFWTRDASRVGFCPVPWSEYLKVTALNLGALLLIALAVEPWSHTYQALLSQALATEPPDTTFAWLVRYDGLPAWGGLLLYSGLVTIFAEELFFRGWLLQLLQRRMPRLGAIVLQAALFTLPQGLAALVLAPLQGVLFAVVYSWLAIGLVGGWAAARTQSIWPSLTAAVLFNFILTFVLL